MREDDVTGMLLGTALGDALGLPFEGRSRRLTIGLLDADLRHRFVFGRGMVSDDTEHAALTIDAVLRSGGDAGRFRHELASSLRWWLSTMPPGVGLATLKSCARLCVGVDPSRSGSPSAGNGAAMRAPAIGVMFRDDAGRRQAFCEVSTEMTHSDRRARVASRAVADLSALVSGTRAHPTNRQVTDSLVEDGDGKNWRTAVSVLGASLARGEATTDFALALCGAAGVSGFVEHSIPVAIHAYARHPHDFEAMIVACIACGGDTDSVAAIAGAIFGATWGADALPRRLLEGIADWPCGVRGLRALGAACALDAPWPRASLLRRLVATRPVGLRNVAFLAIGVCHVGAGACRGLFRRPYR